MKNNKRVKLAKTKKVSTPKTRVRKTRVVKTPEAPAPMLLGNFTVARTAPAEAVEALPSGESLSTDPIRIYMREIGQVALLTPDEEIKLARRIKRGDAAAREHMIKANLRLVVKIARDYENYGLPLLDLISEGNIGLMKAVERFDPNKGAKLSTYASWWIKQAIKRALADQSKTIRLPVHVVDKLFHIRKVETQLVEILGREPTDA